MQGENDKVHRVKNNGQKMMAATKGVKEWMNENNNSNNNHEQSLTSIYTQLKKKPKGDWLLNTVKSHLRNCNNINIYSGQQTNPTV